MNRKAFLKTLSVSAALSPGIVKGITLNKEKIIKPKRLRKGDTLGLIAPGSFISEKELSDSIANIESLGYKAVYSKNILKRNGYLAGTDSERLDDIYEMFSRTDVNGIICARGGYGCARFLPMLDYEIIKKNPKILIGYSDVTSLIYGIFAKTGLVCFHGPVGISTFNEYSIKYFESVLSGSNSVTFYSSDESDFDEKASLKRVTIRSGKARGKLAGGNLSIVVSMIGTSYDIDTDEKIIFLEEIGEEPYRIDRMLTQMLQAGKFEKAAGIILGVFKNCEPKENDSDIQNSFSLSEVLFDRLYNLKIPVIYGLSFGHIKNKITLPVGITAEMNTADQTLTLLEPACS
jgi:muramoyltetrapeptide carboxypeptidase